MKQYLSLILVCVCMIALCACQATSDNTLTTETIEATESIITVETKQETWEKIFAQQEYILDNSQVSLTINDKVHSNMWTTSSGEIIYTNFGEISDGRLEATVYQDTTGKTYFHYYENTPAHIEDSWYVCTNPTNYETSFVYDLSKIEEALKNIHAIEYVVTVDGLDHIIVYTNTQPEHLEESDAYMVYDLFVDATTNRVVRLRYYEDDIEFYFEFPQHKNIDMSIPDNIPQTMELFQAMSSVSLVQVRLNSIT